MQSCYTTLINLLQVQFDSIIKEYRRDKKRKGIECDKSWYQGRLYECDKLIAFLEELESQ